MTAAIAAKALLLAAGLVDDIDNQRHRETLAFGEGYVVGFQAGHKVGVGSVYHRIHEGSVVGRLKHGPLTESLADLIRRRAEPGQIAEAWRARHGGEFTGGAIARHGDSVVLAEPWRPQAEGDDK